MRQPVRTLVRPDGGDRPAGPHDELRLIAFDQGREPLRLGAGIVVDERDDIATGGQQAGIACAGQAAFAAVFDDGDAVER